MSIANNSNNNRLIGNAIHIVLYKVSLQMCENQVINYCDLRLTQFEHKFHIKGTQLKWSEFKSCGTDCIFCALKSQSSILMLTKQQFTSVYVRLNRKKVELEENDRYSDTSSKINKP